MRISQIDFKAGPRTGERNLSIEPGRITIFVGPNNTGKSLALEEIETWLNGETKENKVLSETRLKFPEYKELEEWLLNIDAVQTKDDGIVHLYRPSYSSYPPESMIVNLPDEILGWLRALNGNDKAHAEIRKRTVKWVTLRLDGNTRFQLTEQKPLGDLQMPAKNHLVKLFRTPQKRIEWRELCETAFQGMYAVIDHTSSPDVRVRMSKRLPKPEEETGLDPTAVGYHREAVLINEMGDGVRAFTGLGSVITSLEWRYLLVDDPEAYLHPPVARMLGRVIARKASEYDAQVFVSTHSSHFIQGCFDVSGDVTIVRLTYDSSTGKASASAFDSSQSKHIFEHPLLKSTKVYDALFHSGAIITEGDTDRVFYDEVNRRLIDIGGGCRSCLFISAYSRDSVGIIAEPLTTIGIPTAAVVDLEYLFDGGKKWNELLKAMKVESTTKQKINEESNKIRTDIKKAGLTREDIKSKGLRNLSDDLAMRFWQLLERLGNCGIFCVPMGELESWFDECDIKGKTKSEWLLNCLEHLKSIDLVMDGFNSQSPFWLMVNVGSWLESGRIHHYHIESKYKGEVPLPEGGVKIGEHYQLDPPHFIFGEKRTKFIPVLIDEKHAISIMEFAIGQLMEASGGTIIVGANDAGYTVGLQKTMENLNLSSPRKLKSYIASVVETTFGPDYNRFCSIKLERPMNMPVIVMSVKPYYKQESLY